MLTSHCMYLQWYLELLRLYCRFDSYRERSILSGNERKIIAVFLFLNCPMTAEWEQKLLDVEKGKFSRHGIYV